VEVSNNTATLGRQNTGWLPRAGLLMLCPAWMRLRKYALTRKGSQHQPFQFLWNSLIYAFTLWRKVTILNAASFHLDSGLGFLYKRCRL
jgi:hypothetical protein